MIPLPSLPPREASRSLLQRISTIPCGFKESEMQVIGKAIATVIDNYKDKSVLEKVKADILELTSQFPLYPDLGILE